MFSHLLFHFQTSEFGLTEADLVPLYFSDASNFDPLSSLILDYNFYEATEDLSFIDDSDTYVMGLVSFHPYMNSGKIHCLSSLPTV